MKLKFFLVLSFFMLAMACSNSSGGGSGTKAPANTGGGGQGGQPANQLDTSSPMYGVVGEWTGAGRVTMKQSQDENKYRCDHVTLSILSKTSTEFSFKSAFACTDESGSAQISFSEEETWTIKDNNIYAGDLLIGSINAGVVNLHILQDGYDLTWNITINGKHMSFAHVSQSQNFYMSENAELALP